MTTPKLCWVAWMARWNEPAPENGYTVGVFSDMAAAQDAGERASASRGRKYEFQHCPAHLDLIRATPETLTFEELANGTEVYVASVTGWGRCHFLGVFSSPERAVEAGAAMYFKWTVKTTKCIVGQEVAL